MHQSAKHTSNEPTLTLAERIVRSKAWASDVSAALVIASQPRVIREQRIIGALATRILKCNRLNNTWVISDAVERSTGEWHEEQVGAFWRCDSKLCPRCVAYRARMHRKQIREAISRQKPRLGERYRFITLTMQNPNLPLLKTRELINRAWCLFRKRSLCVSLISGAVKSEEFTVTPKGFHYHIHLLTLSRWIEQSELARVWTDCVRAAFDERGIPFEPATANGKLVVDIRAVRGTAANPFDTERGVREVTKYVTKSTSWLDLPSNVLADIALVERWHRMHELIGSFAEARRHIEMEKAEQKLDRDADEPSLDTRHLSDETLSAASAELDQSADPNPNYWRRKAERMTIEAYSAALEIEIEQAKLSRINQLREYYVDPTILTMQDLIHNQRRTD